MGRISSTLHLGKCPDNSVCTSQKILLPFGLMQRPITFPFPLYQPPVKIDISSSPCIRLTVIVYHLSHLYACVYHPTLCRHPLVFFPTSSSLPLSLSLSFPRSPLSSIFLFLIFNPHSPSHMTHWDTSSSYLKHLEVVRDAEMRKRRGREGSDGERNQSEKRTVCCCVSGPS